MAGSEQMFNDVLAPGMTLNLHMIGGAGGDIAAPGDYLFLDRRQPFLEFGLWNILRVTDGESGSADPVKIRFALTENGVLSVTGRNGIRPAGDFAPQVTVYDGSPSGTGCSGMALGSARVNPGNGAWRFTGPVGAPPSAVCVESQGGGVAGASVGP